MISQMLITDHWLFGVNKKKKVKPLIFEAKAKATIQQKKKKRDSLIFFSNVYTFFDKKQ